MRIDDVLAAAVALALASATLPACESPEVAAADAEQRRHVEAALDRYEDLMQAMDHAGLAAMYAVDGELANAGEHPVKGPKAIEAYLDRFAMFRVLDNRLEAMSTEVHGSAAEQRGTYRQHVRTGTGEVMTVAGTFIAEWTREPDGGWKLHRMTTTGM